MAVSPVVVSAKKQDGLRVCSLHPASVKRQTENGVVIWLLEPSLLIYSCKWMFFPSRLTFLAVGPHPRRYFREEPSATSNPCDPSLDVSISITQSSIAYTMLCKKSPFLRQLRRLHSWELWGEVESWATNRIDIRNFAKRGMELGSLETFFQPWPDQRL